MKNKRPDESEMKRREEILKNTVNDNGFTYNVNRILYETSVKVYNLTQRIMTRKIVYCKSKEDEPAKKERKLN